MYAALNPFATPDFWFCHRYLPAEVRELADKNFGLMRDDLKKVGAFWSARVGLHYRAPARERAEGLVWFWVGHHSEYDRLVQS